MYLNNDNFNFIIKFLLIMFLMIIFTKLYKLKFVYTKYHTNLNIALCTMGKKENLYVKEFIDYYIKLGIDHIFIYDNNDPNTEKIIDKIESRYKNKVTVYETSEKKITNQAGSFTDCYQNNKFIL